MLTSAEAHELTVFETVVFLDHFSDLPDVRMAGKLRYPMDEILLLCLAATISGAATVSGIAQFGASKIEFLRRFRQFLYGTPAHDTLGDILASIDPQAFQRCFTSFASSLIGAPVEAISLDGKTARGARKKGGKAAHIVSAFAARERLVLGQVKVDEKSNEIVAIPALLDMIDVEGAVVTIDAMGCQRVIAAKIVGKRADYVLALKGNQGALHDDVETLVAEQKERNFADVEATTHETVDGDHGRIETRKVTVIHGVDWLVERHKWPGQGDSRRRQPPRDGREGRNGDAAVHHLVAARRAASRQLRARALGDREQPALGHGHDLPRRRLPGAQRAWADQPLDHPARFAEPAARRAGQALDEHEKPQGGLGRQLPRDSPSGRKCRPKNFTRFPWIIRWSRLLYSWAPASVFAPSTARAGIRDKRNRGP